MTSPSPAKEEAKSLLSAENAGLITRYISESGIHIGPSVMNDIIGALSRTGTLPWVIARHLPEDLVKKITAAGFPISEPTPMEVMPERPIGAGYYDPYSHVAQQSM